MFVAGLPFSYSEESLKQLFSECGNVVSANIIIDRETGKGKGFGFVEMGTPEEANAAITKYNEFELMGRKLVVNFARPREERPRGNYNDRRPGFSGGRGRDSRGFGGGSGRDSRGFGDKKRSGGFKGRGKRF